MTGYRSRGVIGAAIMKAEGDSCIIACAESPRKSENAHGRYNTYRAGVI
jgi:hypothetical protein